MTVDSKELSVYDSKPIEAYWFVCGAKNWRFTDGDRDLVINGQIFLREALDRTEIEQTDESRAGEIKVQLPLDNEVAQLFSGKLSPRPVSLVIYGCEDGETDYEVTFVGMVSSYTTKDVCELTVVTEKDTMKLEVPGLLYQSQCPRELFSDGCTLRPEDWEVLGTIANISGNVVTIVAAASKADGWFNGGWMEVNSTGMAITNHVGNLITLFFAMDNIAVGDNVVLYPGCQGTEDACRTKFNNLVNGLMFATIPEKNPFGAGGIV